MDIDLGLQVVHLLSHIEELLGELDAISQVM